MALMGCAVLRLEAAGPAPLAAKDENEAALEMAPVVLDGYVLFKVRGAAVYPAQERATAITHRLKNALGDKTLGPKDFRIEEDKEVTALWLGDRFIVRVFDADSGAMKTPRHLLAEIYHQRLSEAVQRYREERSPRRLLESAGLVALATALFVFALWGLGVLLRRFQALVDRHMQAAVQGMQSKTLNLLSGRPLWMLTVGLVASLRWILLVSLGYAWLAFVLGLFPWTRPLGNSLFSVLIAPLRQIGQATLEAVPGLVFIAIALLLTRYAIKALRLLFDGLARGHLSWQGFDPEWARPTYKIVRLLIMCFSAVIIYPYIPGSSSDAFKGISLFLGIVFSLGSTSVISNLIAGYSMTYRRAFKVGDRIQVKDIVGEVTDIGTVVTRIRTIKNEDVVVPNSLVLNECVVNYSTLARKGELILHTTVGIGYETSWRQVEAMLKLAAERTEGLLKTPPPFVLHRALGDFAVTYEINAYVNDPLRYVALQTALHQNILDLFNEYGIQIMTPAYEGDPEAPKVVPKNHWFAAPAKPPPPKS